MNSKARKLTLKKLFDLCDDLQRLRSKMADPELKRDMRSQLRRQAKRKVSSLARALTTYRFQGPLGHAIRAMRFSPEHFQIIATLLHRHMRTEDPALQGRLILASVYEGSFDVLAGMELLHEQGPLRKSGMIIIEGEDQAHDLLEARFRLSEEALEALREEAAGVVPEDMRRNLRSQYANHREYLMDLRILHNLYKLRSERVFNQDRWDRVHLGTLGGERSISRRIDKFWQGMMARLANSPRAEEFPILQFQKSYGLSPEELMIVVHLLFQELYEGNPQADAVDLLRLVSENEGDLIKNRRLILPSGKLRASEILINEPMIEGREMTGEAHLNDWVVNSLFSTNLDQQISPDEQLEWHRYLKSLDDSRGFFRDLEAN